MVQNRCGVVDAGMEHHFPKKRIFFSAIITRYEEMEPDFMLRFKSRIIDSCVLFIDEL